MASNKTYELAIKIAGKVDGSTKKACGEASKALDNIGSAAKAAAKATAVVGGIVTTAAVAAGKALYDLGSEFDAAYDNIRIGTGATGEALEGLKDSMKNVLQSVPADMESASKAIADYNTRLGVTGGTLEKLSAQAIQVSDMLGEDLTTVVESSSQAFQQWNIAEENMAGAMDYIFKVSQSTGVGFSDLMGNMQSYGAQLQEMGYSFEESAALLGQLEKAGVNASEVMGAMKKSVANMADEGLSASEGLQKYYDAIKNAGTATEAINIASEVFGTRAGSTMALAIRDGTLAASDLTSELMKSGETISGAATDTYDFAEKWQMFTNRMKVALEPMAMTVFDSMAEAMDALMPTIEALLPVITESINAIMPAIQQLIPVVVEIATFLAGEIVPVLSELISTLLPPIMQLIQGLLPVIMQLVQTVLPPVMQIINKLIPPLMQIINAILPVVTALVQALGPVIDALMLAINPILDVVIQLIPPIAQIITQLAPIITLIGQLVAMIIEQLAPVISFIAELIGSVLNAAFASISPIIEGVTAIFSGLIDFISNVFSGNWSAAWDAIVGVFGNIFGTIVEIAKMPINAVINAINFCIEKINGISVTVPDWVPVLGGETFGFNIPTIPTLATGGIATAPTLAEIGEGGEPEAVIPLSKLDTMLNERASNISIKVQNQAPEIGQSAMGLNTKALQQLAQVGNTAISALAQVDTPRVADQAVTATVNTPVTVQNQVPSLMGLNATAMRQLSEAGTAAIAMLAQANSNQSEEAPLVKLAGTVDDQGRNGKKPKDWREGEETINFSPVFNFYGGAPTQEEMTQAARISFAEFEKFYKQMKARERRTAFSQS